MYIKHMSKEETDGLDDPLIQGLIAAKGKRVEVFAFGLTYIGELESVDTENGFISVKDGEDAAVLELERIENFGISEE